MKTKKVLFEWKCNERDETGYSFDRFIYAMKKADSFRLSDSAGDDPGLWSTLGNFVRTGILHVNVGLKETVYTRTGFNIATITFEENKYPPFHVLHNMPIYLTHNSVSAAVDNWMARTDEFTAQSFKRYVEGKNTGHIVRLMKQAEDGHYDVEKH